MWTNAEGLFVLPTWPSLCGFFCAAWPCSGARRRRELSAARRRLAPPGDSRGVRCWRGAGWGGWVFPREKSTCSAPFGAGFSGAAHPGRASARAGPGGDLTVRSLTRFGAPVRFGVLSHAGGFSTCPFSSSLGFGWALTADLIGPHSFSCRLGERLSQHFGASRGALAHLLARAGFRPAASSTSCPNRRLPYRCNSADSSPPKGAPFAAKAALCTLVPD